MLSKAEDERKNYKMAAEKAEIGYKLVKDQLNLI